MENMSIFVEILVDHFIKNNTNVHNFAKKVDITETTIGRRINVEGIPTLENLIKISNYLNFSVYYLVGKSEVNSFVKSENPSFLSERLKILVEKNNTTFYRVVKQLKISNATVTKWIKHNRVQKIETLIKLSDIFGCSIEFLIGRSEY